MMYQNSYPTAMIKHGRRCQEKQLPAPTRITICSVAIPSLQVEPQSLSPTPDIPVATTTQHCSQQNFVSASFIVSIISAFDPEKAPVPCYAIVEWYNTDSGTPKPARFTTRHLINNGSSQVVLCQPTLAFTRNISEKYAQHATAHRQFMMASSCTRYSLTSCCNTDSISPMSSVENMRRRHRRRQQQKHRHRSHEPSTAAELEDFKKRADQRYKETGETSMLLQYMKLKSMLGN
ncbi:hypothetical protein QBC35DRAFT_44851 [Podospora australis]|uniref:Uncharacterized protein n=1 Tax=Podospora australis TaxID=1536484 RepID=A0AAN7ALY1_9PEZI|nr:hypothetical protein QBC35DRAFT_44851 [Podospora australis]